MTQAVSLSAAKLVPTHLWKLIYDFVEGHEFGHVSRSWNEFCLLRFTQFCERDEALKEYLTLRKVQDLPPCARMLAIYRTIIARSKEAVNEKLPEDADCATFNADAAQDGMRLGKIRGAITTFHPAQWVELAKFTKAMEDKWHPVTGAPPATPAFVNWGFTVEEMAAAAAAPSPAVVISPGGGGSESGVPFQLPDLDQKEEELVATLPMPATTLFSPATDLNGWGRQASSSSMGGSGPGATVPLPLTELNKFNNSLDLSSPDHSAEGPKEEPTCFQSFYSWCSSWCSYFTEQATRFINYLRGVA